MAGLINVLLNTASELPGHPVGTLIGDPARVQEARTLLNCIPISLVML